MTKAERAKIVSDELARLYPDPQIPLRSRNVFTFLVAVVLSAQCTDKRVNEVSPKLFDLADTPEKMAALSVEKIRSIIQPCGLSKTKAKNIHALSEILSSKHGGEVPESFEALEETLGKLKLEEPLFITYVAKKSFADTIFNAIKKNNTQRRNAKLRH